MSDLLEESYCNYLRALSLLEDRVIILDSLRRKVLWMSEKIRTIYPRLRDDSSIDQVVKEIFITSDARKELKNKLHEKKPIWQKTSIHCEDHLITICKIDEKKYLLRVNEISFKDEAFSRQLEDRQKLLFTSTSISVSEMASTLAHEINQPVGTINNLLQGIKDRLIKSDNNNKSVIWAINKSIEQLEYTSNIIARIRDYAQSKKPKVNAIDIIALIDKCISLMDWEIRHTNVRIKHCKNIRVAIVHGDELMLQQVIVNLIRNGIEAIKAKDKQILISTNQDGEYLEISIKDNGCGLNESEENNLFLPFSSNKSNGMGVGLNICRSFIELHRGRIWLTNNKSQGCTSHVLLPIESQVAK